MLLEIVTQTEITCPYHLTDKKTHVQIKVQLDTLERTKDEESKKFKSQKIHFDFSILIRIKELMVDVSSGCMELALKVSSYRIPSNVSILQISLQEQGLKLKFVKIFKSGRKRSKGHGEYTEWNQV